MIDGFDLVQDLFELVDLTRKADGHLGYVMPIGGVAAYRDRVSVVGVGFDIACGNAAIRTNLRLSALGGTVSALGSGFSLRKFLRV